MKKRIVCKFYIDYSNIRLDFFLKNILSSTSFFNPAFIPSYTKLIVDCLHMLNMLLNRNYWKIVKNKYLYT